MDKQKIYIRHDEIKDFNIQKTKHIKNGGIKDKWISIKCEGGYTYHSK